MKSCRGKHICLNEKPSDFEMCAIFACSDRTARGTWPFGAKEGEVRNVFDTGRHFRNGPAGEDIPKLMEFFKVKHVEIFQEEVPQQRVKLSAFYLDKHEVTNAQFQALLSETLSGGKTSFPPNGKTANILLIGTGTILQRGTRIFRSFLSRGMQQWLFALIKANDFPPSPNGNGPHAAGFQTRCFRGEMNCLTNRARITAQAVSMLR
jgi:hypothetical protein